MDIFDAIKRGKISDIGNLLVRPKNYGQFEEDSRLMLAAENGLVEDLKSALADGEDVEFRDECDFTPLIVAAANGHADCVRLLLEHGANVKATNNDDYTALLKATENAHFDCMHLLLLYKSDVDVSGPDYDTPLMISTVECGIKHIRLLLDYGADPRITDPKGFEQVETLSGSFAKERLNFLLDYIDAFNKKKNRVNDTIVLAAEIGHVEYVRRLIKNGANVNVTTAHKCTALGHAMDKNNKELTRLLLDNGADIKYYISKKRIF